MPASWVIVEIATGRPIMETFSATVAAAIRRDRFRVVPILEWLHSLNAK